MSIWKTVTVAALSLGIVGGASAAENKFVAPEVVKAIVSGEILDTVPRIPAGEKRMLMVAYLVGFGSGMHVECAILPGSVEPELLKVVKKVADGADANTRAMRAGYDDARHLTGTYGCGSDVGKAASRTVLQYMK